MAILIRALAAADAAAFHQIRLEQLEREPYTFAESAEDIAAMSVREIGRRLTSATDDAFVVGAFEDRLVIGTAGFFRQREVKTRHKGRVWGVYVKPAYRRRGVARALLDALVERVLMLQGVEQLTLSVAASQLAARRLYESFGFEVYGREPRALKLGDEYVDEELMILRLV